MKAKDIRSMNQSEVETKLAEFQDKYFKQRIQKSLGQAENPQKTKQTKKDIARLLTILSEKKRLNDGESGNKTKES
ncbi:MAG: 50S ribosomal protein L29 [Candidatus Omnitrophota bacterium]